MDRKVVLNGAGVSAIAPQLNYGFLQEQETLSFVI